MTSDEVASSAVDAVDVDDDDTAVVVVDVEVVAVVDDEFVVVVDELVEVVVFVRPFHRHITHLITQTSNSDGFVYRHCGLCWRCGAPQRHSSIWHSSRWHCAFKRIRDVTQKTFSKREAKTSIRVGLCHGR